VVPVLALILRLVREHEDPIFLVLDLWLIVVRLVHQIVLVGRMAPTLFHIVHLSLVQLCSRMVLVHVMRLDFVQDD